MTGRIDPAIVPGSVSDLRGRAFGRTMLLALDEIAFRRLLVARIDEVPDELLPYLVREFGMQKFVEPGMTSALIRRLLKGSYRIHSRTGFIDAVRGGLGFMGVEIVSWRQWFQMAPPGAPGTHRVRLRLTEALFVADGLALTARTQAAIRRMITGTQRHSQDIAAGIVFETRAPVHIGMMARSRVRLRQRLSCPKDKTVLVRSYFSPTASNMRATSKGFLSRSALDTNA